MKNEKEILSLYTAKDTTSESRKWAEKPCENFNYVYATDFTRCIRIDRSVIEGNYTDNECRVTDHTFKVGLPCERTLTLAAIDELLAEAPLVYPNCEECYGSGEVETTYTAYDGTAYEVKIECPVCEGTGKDSKGTPTHMSFTPVRLLPDKDLHFYSGNLSALAQTMRLLEIDSVTIIQLSYALNVPTIFRLTDKIDVILMHLVS